MRAVIIGAGIGGLAAGIALQRVGITAVFIEQVETIREVGAGLSLWPNAVHALEQLGIANNVTAAASVIERNLVQTPAGREIAVTEFAHITREYGAPTICIHRGALQRILLERLSPAEVLTGSRATGFDGATAILENGKRIAGDLLIGADGISSAIRAALHGNKPARYSGYTCWRGICEDAGTLPAGTALLATGGGRQFGIWPCGQGQRYWFFTLNCLAGSRVDKRVVLSRCRDCSKIIVDAIERTPESAILQNDIFDRPALASWGRGPVTLLGDAAHATTPNLGQGACMALEDAVVLAHCLSKEQQPEPAFREYERLRIPRTRMIVNESRRAGRMLQLDQPALEAIRNWITGSPFGTRMQAKILGKVLSYKVPQLS